MQMYIGGRKEKRRNKSVQSNVGLRKCSPRSVDADVKESRVLPAEGRRLVDVQREAEPVAAVMAAHFVPVEHCAERSSSFVRALYKKKKGRLTWNKSQRGADAPNERRAHERRSKVERPLAERMRDGHETLDRHEREQQQRDLRGAEKTAL